MSVWIVGVFFFKQKTAYEVRISDWSSDVCSSDLRLDECSSALQALVQRQQDRVHAVEEVGGAAVFAEQRLAAGGAHARAVEVDVHQQPAAFRGADQERLALHRERQAGRVPAVAIEEQGLDRKGTRLNSSH